MKNPITTKDLLVLSELILFEQWSATKFRHYYDFVKEKKFKKILKDGCIGHNDRHDALFDYLKTNADGGEKK